MAIVVGSLFNKNVVLSLILFVSVVTTLCRSFIKRARHDVIGTIFLNSLKSLFASLFQSAICIFFRELSENISLSKSFSELFHMH